MRNLIFGDVHGNLPALEKLLKLEKGNYDFIICHGDVVNYGPWSNDCVELLSKEKDIICLKGNHEVYFLKGAYPGENKIANAFFEVCFPSFSQFHAISNYGDQNSCGNYTIRHTIQDTYIFPDTDLDSINLNGNYIIGHSHYQFSRNFENYNLINTGSLGQNRKYINEASYVILDSVKNSVELKSFQFNIDLCIAEMKFRGYPSICIDYYKNKKRL